MKKLVAILLLSFTLPLCAMEAAEDGSGSDRGKEVVPVIGIMGMTPSPARPSALRMSKGSKGNQLLRPLFQDDEVEPTDPVLATVSKVLDVAAAAVGALVSGGEGAVSAPATMDLAREDENRIGDRDAPVSPPNESRGGGGGASSRVPVENASPISKWYSPKSPVFRIVAPATFGAIIIGGLTRRHVKKQRALGKPTVFDRMGQWVQRRYRGLVRSPKKPAGEDGRREKTTSETSA